MIKQCLQFKNAISFSSKNEGMLLAENAKNVGGWDTLMFNSIIDK